MRLKTVLGWTLAVVGAVRIVLDLVNPDMSSYGMGQLVAGILFFVTGVWLIQSGRQRVRRQRARR